MHFFVSSVYAEHCQSPTPLIPRPALLRIGPLRGIMNLTNRDLTKECACMIILGSIFLLIVGVLMLCFPDVVYCITESWKSNASSEPSGLYKIHIRIGGIACSLVGIAGIIANFIL